jgi:hypothetical protein
VREIRKERLAKVKKYFWLLLKGKFFSERDLEKLKNIQNDDKHVRFLKQLELRLKELEENKVYRNLVPYDVGMLAEITGIDIDDVKPSIETLKEMNLIKVIDSDEIYQKKLEELMKQ